MIVNKLNYILYIYIYIYNDQLKNECLPKSQKYILSIFDYEEKN
jgi:hypothetical protein